MTRDARVVTAASRAPASAVYAFAHAMENLPRWAAGLASNVARDGDAWVADTPDGRLRIVMAPRNAFGVLDHDVTTPDGVTTHNAMRVTPVDDGSLLAFVVLRMPGATDAEFERDCGLVTRDLETLGALVESERRGG